MVLRGFVVSVYVCECGLLVWVWMWAYDGVWVVLLGVFFFFKQRTAYEL